jgi:hypothetical protein
MLLNRSRTEVILIETGKHNPYIIHLIAEVQKSSLLMIQDDQNQTSSIRSIIPRKLKPTNEVKQQDPCTISVIRAADTICRQAACFRKT